MLCALEGNWYRARFIKYFDTAQWWGPCHRSAWTFYKEKIEYQLEMIYKLRVKVVVQAEAQPLVVSMSDKSNQGVVMYLTQMLAMLSTEDVTLTDPLTLINKSLSWSAVPTILFHRTHIFIVMVPTCHYAQSNPYSLLCPQYSDGQDRAHGGVVVESYK